MKILIQAPIEPVLEGILQALVKISKDVMIWDTRFPFNDVLDKYKPDIIFGYNSHLTYKPPNTKLVILGDSNVSADLICTTETYTSTIPNRYKIEPAANLLYPHIQYSEEHSCEVFYHSQRTTPETLQYLQEIEKHYQLKVIGQHRLPLTSYLGVGTEGDVLQCTKSCKVALAFDVHTLYTYAINKIPCFTTCQNDFISHVDTADTLIAWIADLFQEDGPNTPDGGQYVMESNVINAYKHAIQNTYFHRLNDIFNLIDEPSLAEQCLNKLNSQQK